MAVIESCEKNVAISNGLMVPDEHASEVFSNDTVCNNNNVVVQHHPERVDETKECLVQRRVSLRPQNQSKVNNGSDDRKRSMSDDGTIENNSVQKKTRLNPFMQQRVFESSQSDTCCHSSDCGVACVACGDGLVSNYTNAFPHGMDLTTILRFKETLRLVNLKKLPSAEEEQNRCKKEENNYLGAAKFSRKKIHSTYPWYAISKQGYDSLTLVSKDISDGQEDVSIRVTNEYDVPPVGPAGFTYIKSIQFANNVKVPSVADGCQCKGSCRNTRTRTCSCVLLNGSVPYDARNGGRLTAPRDVVFECGPRCRCGPDCGNRVSQKGIKYQLEVYRSRDKGWAVRTLDKIPAGAPVCEYVGVLRRNDELDNVTENDYIFDIDCKQTINEIDGRERRLCNVSLPTSPSVEKRDDKTMETEPEFCIDAGSYGNVARFINHSCEPNLFVQCVLSSHHDIKLARVVLFAAKKIRPYQELTYDYGYQLDSVMGPDGKIKQMPCYCGEANCRKRLY